MMYPAKFAYNPTAQAAPTYGEAKQAADYLFKNFKGGGDVDWAKSELEIIRNYASQNNLKAMSKLATVIENEFVPGFYNAKYTDAQQMIKVLDVLVLICDKNRVDNVGKIESVLSWFPKNDPFAAAQLKLIDQIKNESGPSVPYSQQFSKDLDQLEKNATSYANSIFEIKETLRGISTADYYASNYQIYVPLGFTSLDFIKEEIRYKPKKELLADKLSPEEKILDKSKIPNDIIQCATYYLKSIITGCEFSINNSTDSDVLNLYANLKENAQKGLDVLKGMKPTPENNYQVVEGLINFKQTYESTVSQAQTEEYWNKQYAGAKGPFGKSLVYFEKNAGTIQLMSAITLSMLCPPLGKGAFTYMGAESVVGGVENEDVKQVLFGIAMMAGYAKNQYVSGVSVAYINTSIAIDTWNMVKLARQTAFTSTAMENIGLNALFLGAYAKSVKESGSSAISYKNAMNDVSAKGKIAVNTDAAPKTGTGVKTVIKIAAKSTDAVKIGKTNGESSEKQWWLSSEYAGEMPIQKITFTTESGQALEMYNYLPRELTADEIGSMQKTIEKVYFGTEKNYLSNTKYIVLKDQIKANPNDNTRLKTGDGRISENEGDVNGITLYTPAFDAGDYHGLNVPKVEAAAFHEFAHRILDWEGLINDWNKVSKNSKEYVTDYAKTNTIEDFCDSYMAWRMGLKLPEQKAAFMEEHFTASKGGNGSTVSYKAETGAAPTTPQTPDAKAKSSGTKIMPVPKTEAPEASEVKAASKVSAETSTKIETLIDLPEPFNKLSVDYLKANGLGEESAGLILAKGDKTAGEVFLELSKLSPGAAKSYLSIVGKASKLPVLNSFDATNMKLQGNAANTVPEMKIDPTYQF